MTMKKLMIVATMLFAFGTLNAQISEVFNNLNEGKELLYTATNKGCLTITKKSFKQSYSDNCDKPIDFTINNMALKDNRIQMRMTMHFYGDVKLVGFMEIKDNVLVLSYGESPTSEQQVDKYKFK
jgi:hypothetical protein